MSNKLNKTKKALGWLAGAAGVGIGVYLGHQFGLYDLTPAFDFVGVKASEFGTAALTYSGTYVGARVAGSFVSDQVSSRNKTIIEQNDRKIAAEKITQANQEKLMAQNETIMANQRLMISNDIKKAEQLASLSIAPESVKELAINLKESAKAQSLEIADEASNALLDKGMELVDTVIDKGADIVMDKIDDVIKKV